MRVEATFCGRTSLYFARYLGLPWQGDLSKNKPPRGLFRLGHRRF
jgi:hypothetical protein